MRRWVWAAIVVVASSPTRADPPGPPAGPARAASDPPATPKPDAPRRRSAEEAATAALAASDAKDDAALAALARNDPPDSWVVADELLARGRVDVALAFARLVTRPGAERLPAYLESRRGRSDDPATRAAVAAALAALRRGTIPPAPPAGERVDPPSVTSILVDLVRGIVLGSLHRSEESAAASLRAAEAAESIGWSALAANAFDAAASAAWDRSDYSAAVASWERCLAHGEIRKDPMTTATALGNLGNCHGAVGEWTRALDALHRSLAIFEAAGRPGMVATTLGNLGNVLSARGDYARALSLQERAYRMKRELGDVGGAAVTLGNIGNLHFALHDFARAIEAQRLALDAKRSAGDRVGVAITLGNLAGMMTAAGDAQGALAVHEQAVAAARETGDRAALARALEALGCGYEAIGAHAKAIQSHEDAIRASTDVGDRDGVAMEVADLAVAQRGADDAAAAYATMDRAATLARLLRSDQRLVSALEKIVAWRLADGDAGRALDAAREALEPLERMFRGLGDEQGAQAHAAYAELFSAGARAALAQGEPADAYRLLESGRARALLEGLGGREKLREVTIPPALRESERSARRAVEATLAAYRDGLRDANLTASRRRRAEVASAVERLESTVAAIEREAKARASVAFPRIADLESVRAGLDPSEALVIYGVAAQRSIALVVTRAGVRGVTLAGVDAITAARDALALGTPEEDASSGIDALRALVVDPLALDPAVTHVLVAPDGPLCYVPFALLMPRLTVTTIPSATAWKVLGDDVARRGTTTLALGDPDYDAVRGEDAGARVGTGARLARLPQTAIEAKAVGDRVLLGKDATVASFRAALAERPRWQSVHLACHGLVDPDRPMLSSLALTPTADHDGMLTALEVFRTSIPADLAVLSGCETGKGRILRGEGVLGLTRAFMFAGAPRVICSLWKVDDAATRALFARFYELWRPRDGAAGRSTADALREAQAYVAAQPAWKHPYYWGAWVLFGLSN